MFKSLLQTQSGNWAVLPLRLAVGSVFLGHGAQKLLGWFDGPGLTKLGEMMAQNGFVPGPFWATLLAAGEFFGGLLILIGLFTRFGALNIAIVMAVAVFKVHWGTFFLPSGIEYAFVLMLSAISLLISGGGAWSLDAMLTSKPACCGHSHASEPVTSHHV